MLTLVPFRRYEPLFDVPSNLAWVDSFFEEVTPSLLGERKALIPEFDLSETDEHIVLKADIAGVDIKDLDIDVTDNVLTVRGEKKEEAEEEKEHYHRVERRFGSFCRSFALPDDVKADQIEATYKDGVLRLTIPKTEAVKPKKIEIKAN